LRYYRGVFSDFLAYAFGQFRSLTVIGALAVLGVAIGAANIIALISVTDTARYQSFALMRDVGASALFVIPFAGNEKNAVFQRSNASAFLPMSYADALRSVPELDRVAALVMFPGHIKPILKPGEVPPVTAPASEAGSATMDTPGVDATDDATPVAEKAITVFPAEQQDSGKILTIVEGTNPDYPDARGHRVSRGRFVTWDDERTKARICILGSTMPARLFGTADPLGREIELKGERLKVVGVLIEKGVIGFESFDDRIFIPLSTAQDMYDMPGVHFIILRARDAESVKAAQKQASAKLRDIAGLTPDEPADFNVSTVEEVTGLIDTTFHIFRLLLYGISSIALLVAGIGIMNVMLMQVIERTREIGIRRAVGARRSAIALQFIMETVAQSLIGTVLGVVLGLAASYGFCWFVKWEPHIRLETVILAALFSAAVGLAFGVFPAIHASRLKPVDCLRYE
jgi:putative ABC transport system permease protein